MKIDIKTSHIDLTPALKEYVNVKVGVLDKFLARWEVEGDVEVRAELNRTTAHHHKGGVFRATLSVHLPKKMLHAEEMAEDIRVAIDGAKNKLKSEIKKYKELHEHKG